jgi:peptide/nickel transport system permease protein
MLSRILIGSQMSLTIGLVGVFLSLIIGSIMGVTSGYFGGQVDNVMQRVIEVIRSFPSVPLWMALAATLPQHWPPERIYFFITVILSFIGWTWLARQLRGKVLALREEEFVMAAQLSGASDAWIIFRHLIPAVFGHIIVIASLAMPGMILAETTLSFLNLGLRPPLISWGVLLARSQWSGNLAAFPVAAVSGAVHRGGSAVVQLFWRRPARRRRPVYDVRHSPLTFVFLASWCLCDEKR